MCAKNRHENWDRKMDGRGFSFNYERKLTIQCVKVNEPIGSSYIKSSDWLRWKHAKINPKNINGRCFQYAFTPSQHHEEIKNHPEGVSNIKSFIDLQNWHGIECPTVI